MVSSFSFSSGRLAAIAVVCMAAAPVSAQDSLQQIKDLYASAAYEDTIVAVTNLDATDPKPEIVQYRVFSLVALGRMAEAEKSVEAVLIAHPRYRPDPGAASPRIQELFSKVRARVGPSAIKALYQSGKEALDKKDRAAAVAQFEELLRTADDPDIKDQASVAELRLLGAGFLELSRALPAAPGSAPAANGTSAAAAPPVPNGSAAAPLEPTVITPPVAIRENLPAWMPPSTAGRIEYVGTIRVQISVNGTVDRAEIIDSVHPSYDPLLLEAAKGWRYAPAKRNGVALPSEKTVAVRLKPQTAPDTP